MGKVKIIINTFKNCVWNYKIDNNPDIFIASLRKCGVTIGDNVLFVKPSSSSIDLTAPYLINIGNNVCISKGFSLFTHDYSSFVQRLNTGEVLGGVDDVNIGSNIQIGANVTVLMGTTIDDYVIVASGAVCKGHLESGFVYGGVPAKKMSTIDDFIKKRKKEQFEEAKKVALAYFQKYRKIPEESIFYSFHLFPCFLEVEKWPESFWNGFGQKMSKDMILVFIKITFQCLTAMTVF